MRVMRTVLPLVTLSALCSGTIGVAQTQQSPQQVTVPFSDPSRQGTLRISLMQGAITIRGTNRKDVLIEARPSEETLGRGRFGRGRGGTIIERDNGGVIILRGRGRGGNDSDSTGLRRLAQPGGFVVEEGNNEMLVAAGAMNGGTDLTIEVPTRIHLTLSAHTRPVIVENVEGEIEVQNHGGSITLTNVAGSVVANAHAGKVKVIMVRLTAEKPMAFTAFNDEVDVTLPASTKANLKMRSDHGEIFTDFDIQIRPSTPAASQNARGSDGRIRIDVNQTIQGSVNGGGPEFELRTISGNIYVRKGAQ